ncbi:MAG: tetratricopeptide repeat protein [Eudoraea sp.]|nr:tetratricopeptide repeat protein [Eudoraea sp.]
MRSRIVILFLCIGCFAQAQDEEKEKESLKALKASKNLTYDANQELSGDNFVAAEADYRRAIAKSKENIAAPYNLGTAYYGKESYGEAFGRFKEAGELASEKAQKHKAFHNMGNVFMKKKEYEKAVEAYKEALRNDPKDEETRYNLALAKEMLKKQQDEQKNDDNKDNKDQQDQKDKDQEQNKGDNKEDKEGDQKEDENKDKGSEGDQDEKKEENKEGQGDEKKEKEQQPEQGDQQEKQQQPRPNQLSKQQIKNLLEAMQNEEKKVQEKIDAKKVKGAKIKNEKDW